MLLAKLMQMLQRISEVPFSLEFLVMDPGYRKENRKKIEDNAELLHIPIRVFESQIFDIANSSGGSPCYLLRENAEGAPVCQRAGARDATRLRSDIISPM